MTSDGITARYRLDLSDGITSLAAFVNSQSTAVIANQGIREYTVIRVTNYRCCVMKDIKMMILNDFEKIHDLDHAIGNKYEEKKPHIQQYTSITSYDQQINNLKNEVNLLRSELFLTEDMKIMLHDQEIDLKKSKNDLKKYKNELKKSNTEISELKTLNSVILSELNDLKARNRELSDTKIRNNALLGEIKEINSELKKRNSALLGEPTVIDSMSYIDILELEHQLTSTLSATAKRKVDVQKEEEIKRKEEEIKRKEEEIKRKEEAEKKLCAICLTSDKCILLRPCNHICLCGPCSTLVTDCPLCRKLVTKKRKVFF